MKILLFVFIPLSLYDIICNFSTELVHTKVQGGAPMPAKMEPYLNKQLFYRIRGATFIPLFFLI